MANLNEFFKSNGYKHFMRRLLLYSAIVFVFGILFLLMHLQGGNIMVMLGGGCLIVVMVFFIIGKIVTREQ